MHNNLTDIDETFLEDFVIPKYKQKPYYYIKEVSEIIEEKQHVIRFWESEFKDIVKPMRGRGNRRLFRKSDIDTILLIKHLLKVKKFTIGGAKKILKKRDLRELIKEEALTPNTADKVRFLTEQIKILIEDMERLRNSLTI